MDVQMRLRESGDRYIWVVIARQYQKLRLLEGKESCHQTE